MKKSKLFKLSIISFIFAIVAIICGVVLSGQVESKESYNFMSQTLPIYLIIVSIALCLIGFILFVVHLIKSKTTSSVNESNEINAVNEEKKMTTKDGLKAAGIILLVGVSVIIIFIVSFEVMHRVGTSKTDYSSVDEYEHNTEKESNSTVDDLGKIRINLDSFLSNYNSIVSDYDSESIIRNELEYTGEFQLFDENSRQYSCYTYVYTDKATAVILYIDNDDVVAFDYFYQGETESLSQLQIVQRPSCLLAALGYESDTYDKSEYLSDLLESQSGNNNCAFKNNFVLILYDQKYTQLGDLTHFFVTTSSKSYFNDSIMPIVDGVDSFIIKQ